MPPRVLLRPEHSVSRKGIDPDALGVLYRLKNHGFLAYLVGGGVRDLLTGRKPKDFDVGTSAHPQQVKRLFRNCFIVGRRFRLCHVRFGNKVVEVSTFRRQARPEDGDTLIRSDNTFGTPEQDAFRRDFTVNALFYDIATFSVIDHVGGLADLELRLIRSIGDPALRFREDPVRMLRGIALAARMDFEIERDTLEAIRFLRGEIVRSSPPRILEEIYKILRQGAARKTFQMLHDIGLLAYLLHEADRAIARDGAALLGSLQRLDEHRHANWAAIEEFTNPLLLGSLLVPLGVSLRAVAASAPPPPVDDADGKRDDLAAEMAALGTSEPEEPVIPPPGLPPPLGLPFARRDLDRIRLILSAQRRLHEVHSAPGAKTLLLGRAYFDDAVRWMEIHGGIEGRELAIHWRSLQAGPEPKAPSEPTAPRPHDAPTGRSRRRRRWRRRPSVGRTGGRAEPHR